MPWLALAVNSGYLSPGDLERPWELEAVLAVLLGRLGVELDVVGALVRPLLAKEGLDSGRSPAYDHKRDNREEVREWNRFSTETDRPWGGCVTRLYLTQRGELWHSFATAWFLATEGVTLDGWIRGTFAIGGVTL